MRTKKTIIISLITIFILFLSLYLSNGKSDSIIIVGTETPPFEYYNENGELVGIDIDFVEKIMKNLDLKYEIQLMNWGDALKEMKEGRADIILEAGYSKERESFISYREEHKLNHPAEDVLWIVMDSFYFLEKNKERFQNFSYEHLQEERTRIGIVNKYHYNDEIWGYNLNFFSYNSAESLLKALEREDVELALIDRLEAEPLLRQLNMKNKTSLSKPIDINENYILFSKEYDKKNKKEIKENFYKELIRLKIEENLHEISYKRHTGLNFTETYGELN